MFNKLSKRWGKVLLITFIIRIFLLTISFVENNFSLNNLFSLWVRWDGPHYIDIAKDGYQITGKQSLWIVFYPLYPLLIRLFNFLVQDYIASAILVSIVFSFFVSILLYELVLLDFNRRTALLSVWFLNIFPTAYFLQASYTESIFLTFSLATIYLFRKNLTFPSSISGFLTTLSRINGLLLLPLLILETKKKKDLIVLLTTPLGFGLYLLINKLLFNDYFYFQKPLLSNWSKKFELPWIGINNLIRSIPDFNNVLFYAYTSEVISLLFIFLIAIFVFFKVKKSYGIYMLLNLLLITSTSFIMSTPRYIFILFPIYIALGMIRNKLLIIVLSLCSLYFLIQMTIIYVKGGWAF